ncbi:MAG: methyltransferase domain-containing protein [Sphingobacteriales bacterium]|nr:MAG: methyltransferase domain-containing protein [Sphingobacteriales bacterium]
MQKADLTVRSTLPELMDGAGVPSAAIRQALKELENVNTYLGGYALILDALDRLQLPDREISIMDLGCGGGDILRSIAAWGVRKKKKLKLIGIDRNPEMTAYARERSAQFPNISYITADVFDDSLLDVQADISMNSLFCHHFDNDSLKLLIVRMQALSNMAVIINDLHRHWLAYHSIRLITKYFSKTYLVKYDAPLSVARAFTREEWENILAQTGMQNYTLRWRWAWRWELIIHKDKLK